MKQFKLTLILTILMSMVGLQAFAAWDTSTKVQVNGLYYYLDNDNLQAQVRSMPSGKYTGAFEIPLDFIYAGKIYSVTSIGKSAFYYCTDLTSVTIPNSVTGIDDYAFEGCTGLTSVTIPNSVTSIGKSAFKGCSGFESITVESGNTKYDSRNDCNAIIETASNRLLYGCMNTIIPNSVTRIDNYAFYGCSGLTSITIPSSVTDIYSHTFEGCSGLTSITISEGVIEIAEYAFSGCSSLTSITIPNSVARINFSAFQSCSRLTSVTLNSNNLVSKAYTSSYNFNTIFGEQVTEYIIGKDVESIGENAFYGCTNLTSVTLYSNAIVSNCLKGFARIFGDQVTEYIIGDDVTSIGSDAFWGCTGLTSITIPNSVTRIEYGAFLGCSGLTSITIPNSVTYIGARAFEGCSGLTSVTIPNSVTNIWESAFNGCSGLTSVIALNPNPVAITEDVFTNRRNATLYVPKGSKEAYQAAAYWKEFKEIVEIEVTGIDQISLQENGEQVIDQEGAVWYTIDGKQLDKPKKGINIIRMKNGTTKKVVVK